MRIYSLVVIIILAFNNCTNSVSKNNTANTENSSNSSNSTSNPESNNSNTSNKTNNGFWQKMVMQEIKDKSGMVAAILPLPASWKLHSQIVDGVSITGPNGVKVTDFAPKNYFISYDQNMQNSYLQSGIQMKPLSSIEQIIQEELVPSAAKRGLKYIKHYELPIVSKLDKWYAEQLYQIGPTQLYNKVYGIEMKYSNGKPAFVVMHVSERKSQELESWYHISSLLDADAAVFETAKKQYIFALENMRYNLEPIMAYNKAEAQRIGQSWAAFNAKMKANQAAFDASQAAHVNKSNAINDAIMSGWKAQNASSDKNQEQFVDYIYENQNVQNTETGKTYKVQQGANQYWMNNNGEYIGTKSNTYDPNLDENMNQQKWQELKQIK